MLTNILSMESINILLWVHRVTDGLLINMGREGQLDQDAINLHNQHNISYRLKYMYMSGL